MDVSLQILNAWVEDFACITKKAFEFKKTNTLVGMNGSGKTTLMRLIAGVFGSDEANLLLVGSSIGKCTLVATDGNEPYVFEHSGLFTHEKLNEFKKRLRTRVNFPMTEWVEKFPYGCIDNATALDRFREFIKRDSANLDHLSFYSTQKRMIHVGSGDGYKSLMHLFLNDSLEGIPLLIEGPEMHLHIVSQRRLLNTLKAQPRQLFVTTHSPEMVMSQYGNDENIIDFS